MEDRIEISGESVLAKVVEAILALGALSLVLYAIVAKCKPFAGRIFSHIIYWVFIVILAGLWLIIANGILKTRRFQIGRGVVEVQESRLVIFRRSESYPRDLIESVQVKPGAGVVFSGPRYDVVLVLKSGKNVRLKTFRSEAEASNFCSEVSALINK